LASHGVLATIGWKSNAGSHCAFAGHNARCLVRQRTRAKALLYVVKKTRLCLLRRGSRIFLSTYNMKHPPAKDNKKCLKDQHIFGLNSHFNDEPGYRALIRSKRALGRMSTRSADRGSPPHTFPPHCKGRAGGERRRAPVIRPKRPEQLIAAPPRRRLSARRNGTNAPPPEAHLFITPGTHSTNLRLFFGDPVDDRAVCAVLFRWNCS
jgi:hypothetical protein